MSGMIQRQNSLLTSLSQRSLAIVGIALVGVAGAVAYGWMQMTAVQEDVPSIALPEIKTVTALGRLKPQGTVVNLSAPTSSQGNRVERLLVQEGDRVQVGQVIAILDSHAQRKAALEEAKQQVNVAQARLDTVRAGAKQGEIDAQKAEINRLKADRQGTIDAQVATVARLQLELQNAQADFDRYQSLYEEGAISASERDRRRLAVDTAQALVQEAQVTLNRLRSTTPPDLNRARATLDRIAEVRPVDVRSAQVEVKRAIAIRQQAQASLAQAVVRSPIAGEVLDIHTRAGEVVSTDGIAEIGQTDRMRAIAEVYQSDVGRVQVGQRARVSSNALSEELTGTVTRVGSQVRRQTIVNTDPSANIDARTIEVEIALDEPSSQKAAKFTNLQVQVVIEQ